MKQHYTVITPGSSWFNIDIKELFQYKDLFWTLAIRDFKVRYAQTFLGFFWALIQPLATLLIFTVVFGKAVRVDTGNIPYPLFAACGMTAWTYFAFVLAQSGNSIIAAQGMVRKIYFPRIIVPLSKAIVGFIDFGIALLILIVIMLIYGVFPSGNIFWLPIFIILNILTALGAGIWLSALTIRYRDFIHIIPFMVQFGLYATPVAYPTHVLFGNLPEWALILFYLNPMAGVVEGYRWSILGTGAPELYMFISFTVAILLFFSSLVYFGRVQDKIADLV